MRGCVAASRRLTLHVTAVKLRVKLVAKGVMDGVGVVVAVALVEALPEALGDGRGEGVAAPLALLETLPRLDTLWAYERLAWGLHD